MNLYPATAYIRHLLTARGTAGHGVHSPFVFDFLTNVLRGKNDPKIYGEVESLRREMLADRRTVMVTDLGAGSATRKGEERRISEIARTAALPPRQAGLLARVAWSSQGAERRSPAPAGGHRAQGSELGAQGSELGARGSQRAERRSPAPAGGLRAQGAQGAERRSPAPAGELRAQSSGLRARGSQRAERRSPAPAGGLRAHEERSDAVPHPREGSGQASDNSIILELGTSLGISTLALALAAPEQQVVTVEGCPALAEIARQNLLRHGAGNVTVINTEFSKALEMLRTHGTTVSMAFIDGNHRGMALKQYTETIRFMGNEMIIVADDIHLSREMYGAWRSLASSGIAAATLETFRFGILFCLRNLTPGDYRIRH